MVDTDDDFQGKWTQYYDTSGERYTRKLVLDLPALKTLSLYRGLGEAIQLVKIRKKGACAAR